MDCILFKTTAVWLTAVLVAACATAEEPVVTKDLTLLMTGDWHGTLEPHAAGISRRRTI